MKKFSLYLSFLFLLSFYPMKLSASGAIHDRDTLSPLTLPPEYDELLRNYEDYWEASDSEALSSLFTVDGFILRPYKTIVRGRKNIEKAYRNAGGPLSLRAYDYGVEGSTAYILGGYSSTAELPDFGKFTLVLKRVKGKWLIHSDMDNPNQKNRVQSAAPE